MVLRHGGGERAALAVVRAELGIEAVVPDHEQIARRGDARQLRAGLRRGEAGALRLRPVQTVVGGLGEVQRAELVAHHHEHAAIARLLDVRLHRAVLRQREAVRGLGPDGPSSSLKRTATAYLPHGP